MGDLFHGLSCESVLVVCIRFASSRPVGFLFLTSLLFVFVFQAVRRVAPDAPTILTYSLGVVAQWLASCPSPQVSSTRAFFRFRLSGSSFSAYTRPAPIPEADVLFFSLSRFARRSSVSLLFLNPPFPDFRLEGETILKPLILSPSPIDLIWASPTPRVPPRFKSSHFADRISWFFILSYLVFVGLFSLSPFSPLIVSFIRSSSQRLC